MKTQGRILKLLPDNLAEVVCEPSSTCIKCRGCGFGQKGEITLQAKNNIKAHVGDLVEVEIAEGEGVKAAFLVFILPVIGLIVGYFAGVKLFGKEIYGVLSAIVFIALVFLALNAYDRLLKSKKECKCQILQILS